MSGQNENKKSGNTTSESSPTLLEMIVKSESSASRQLRKKIEEGSEHPSEELLQAYTTRQLPREGARSVMEHLALCAPCAKKALSLTFQQEELLDEPEEVSTTTSWLEPLKGLVSEFSFPVTIQFPAFEAVRGPESNDFAPASQIGDPLLLYVNIPSEGFITVFHYVEAKDAVKLIFPDRASAAIKIPAGQDVLVLQDEIRAPAGIQGFKVIWTKEPLIDPELIGEQNEADSLRGLEASINKLARLEVDQWMETACVYEVKG